MKFWAVLIIGLICYSNYAIGYTRATYTLDLTSSQRKWAKEINKSKVRYDGIGIYFTVVITIKSNGEIVSFEYLRNCNEKFQQAFEKATRSVTEWNLVDENGEPRELITSVSVRVRKNGRVKGFIWM